MHPIDIESTLKTMKIVIDTREQATEQSKRRYADFGVPWERGKLDFGDYSAVFTLPNGEKFDLMGIVSIERKMSLDELCGCYTHDRARFEREFERAKAVNGKIYLLIEDGSFRKAYNGTYKSQMKPQALIASIFAWLARYNCQIIMAEKELSGKIIKEILYREAKELLQTLDFSGEP
jgi:ERCC4-type nuclease